MAGILIHNKYIEVMFLFLNSILGWKNKHTGIARIACYIYTRKDKFQLIKEVIHKGWICLNILAGKSGK